MLLSHSAIYRKHLNTILHVTATVLNNVAVTYSIVFNCFHLVRKRTLNHFSKLAKLLTCIVITYLYGIHVSFRYSVCFEEGIP